MDQDSDSNERLRQLHDSIEASIDEGLTEHALQQVETALLFLEENYEEADEFSIGDFIMLAGHAHWKDGDLEEAQRKYRQTLDIEPDRVDAATAVGVTLFHLARFEAARQKLEVVTAEDPENDEAWYYLALLALRRDDRALADILFKRAFELEPERWPIPQAVSMDHIHGLLDRMYAEMPEPLKQALGNVPVILEDRPTEALLFSEDPPLDPLMLGLFDGTPLTERSPFEPELAPTRIIIFGENISLIAGDPDELEEELWITLKHEIGHYFGLSEEDLAERGLD